MSYAFSEEFTLTARRVAPLFLGKGLDFDFDVFGPDMTVSGPPVLLQRSAFRLARGALDVMSAGDMKMSARWSCEGHQARVTVQLEGKGAPAGPSIGEVLERLALRTESDLPLRLNGGPHHAWGTCPVTGAGVLLSFGGQALHIQAELPCEVLDVDEEAARCHAQGAKVWLIGVKPALQPCWRERFERLGWRSDCVASCEKASCLLLGLAQEERPRLVVVVEQHAGTKLSAQALALLLPQGARLIFAVKAGSETLCTARCVRGCEVRVYPFSPRDLIGFVRGQVPDLEALDPPHRSVLYVDDNAVNREVGGALLEALGHRAALLPDVLSAVEYCSRTAPDIVLMDIDMPVLDGLEGSRRLKDLQAKGELPPFPVVATTAGTRGSSSRWTAAQFDGFLEKPMSLASLQQELRRVTTLH